MWFSGISERINKFSYFPKYSWVIFLLLLLVLSYIYNYEKILFLRPQGVHQWRQCDCLSITLNYYMEDRNFFEPCVHFLGYEGTGKTISEFPVVYYFVAHLWKLFGYHEYIFRLVTIIITFLGLFALFKLTEKILNDSLWALSFILLLFCSPFFIYYANNFLANVPAFSFVLIAWFFFGQFYKKGKHKFFIASVFFFLLGGLVKVSSLISFIALFLIFLIELFNIYNFRGEEKIFKGPFKYLAYFLVVFTCIISWYTYADYYNHKHNSGIFLIGILPVWKLSIIEIKNIFLTIREIWLGHYFQTGIHIVNAGLFLVILCFYKNTNRFLFTLSVLLVIGFSLYMCLFFQVLNWHDYYMIDLLIVVIAIWLTVLYSLKMSFQKIFSSFILRLVIVIVLIHNIDFARRRMKERYSGWMNKTHMELTIDFENITHYLRLLQIKRDDKVISFTDHSPNISLYLMDQKGWTNFGMESDSISIKKKIDQGAKYLFVNDPEILNNPFMVHFTKKEIGSYGKIKIFDLRNLAPFQ